jgi:hypothetical protein
LVLAFILVLGTGIRIRNCFVTVIDIGIGICSGTCIGISTGTGTRIDIGIQTGIVNGIVNGYGISTSDCIGISTSGDKVIVTGTGIGTGLRLPLFSTAHMSPITTPHAPAPHARWVARAE